MILLQEPYLSVFHECPYINGNQCRYEYFFAFDLSPAELNELLKKGWRKFGTYFFKPQCGECQKCIPLRVKVQEFKPSKSQRRVLTKGNDISIEFNDLEFREDIYEIYRDHSLVRFNRETDVDEFLTTFYTRSCPSLQSEYYINNELFGAGFLDKSDEAISSVYFVFKTNFEEFSPGIFSILNEIEYTASEGLLYYYLGYYIEENQSMSYKNRFNPYEQYNWDEDKWY